MTDVIANDVVGILPHSTRVARQLVTILLLDLETLHACTSGACEVERHYHRGRLECHRLMIGTFRASHDDYFLIFLSSPQVAALVLQLSDADCDGCGCS